jgi:hypothetical protein
MNEKSGIRLVIIIFFIDFFFGCATGFFVGRGDSLRSAGSESANRELTATVGEIRAELDRERTITAGIRNSQSEERRIIKEALDACRGTGEGLHGVITKVEILNGLIRELERRADGGGDLSGSE